tara:strand:+ start:107 stop:808 length:702 start_codon:yes stop_codon:yes gene_type:complete
MISEPIVFLPDLMCDARLFAPQIDGLSHARAVMVAPIHIGERIEEIASGILDVTPHRFALCGLGMGGMVAMEIVRRAPDRVTRLCLMDTNTMQEAPIRAAEREPLIVLARAGNLEKAMQEELGPGYLADTQFKENISKLIFDMAISLGTLAFVRQSRAMQRRRDQQALLRKIKCPTLILCGAKDPFYLPKRHEFIAELIETAHLKVIEDAAHFPTLEQPKETNDALRAWLSAS